MKIVHSGNVFSKKIKNELYVLKHGQDEVRVLNNTARRIWELTKKPIAVAKITEKIVSEYNVNQSQAKTDVESFIEQYLKAGLLTLAD